MVCFNSSNLWKTGEDLGSLFEISHYFCYPFAANCGVESTNFTFKLIYKTDGMCLCMYEC